MRRNGMKKKTNQNGSEPVAEAQQRVADAQAALEAHEDERRAVAREGELLTKDLDDATLAGQVKTMEVTASRLAVIRERAASLDRTRGQRVGAAKHAEDQLAAVQKEMAREEQAALIAKKAELNKQIAEKARELAVLLDSAEATQQQIENLAECFGLDRPKGRLLLPKELVQSSGAEALRMAFDQARIYGLR